MNERKISHTSLLRHSCSALPLVSAKVPARQIWKCSRQRPSFSKTATYKEYRLNGLRAFWRRALKYSHHGSTPFPVNRVDYLITVVWKQVKTKQTNFYNQNRTVSESEEPTDSGSRMIMDTLGPQAFSLSFGNFKITGGEELDPSDPPPPHPTVDIRLVNPCVKKEDEAEGTEDDTLNTPVSTSSDVNTFFLADNTISDPVPITGEWFFFFRLFVYFCFFHISLTLTQIT